MLPKKNKNFKSQQNVAFPKALRERAAKALGRPCRTRADVTDGLQLAFEGIEAGRQSFSDDVSRLEDRLRHAELEAHDRAIDLFKSQPVPLAQAFQTFVDAQVDKARTVSVGYHCDRTLHAVAQVKAVEAAVRTLAGLTGGADLVKAVVASLLPKQAATSSHQQTNPKGSQLSEGDRVRRTVASLAQPPMAPIVAPGTQGTVTHVEQTGVYVQWDQVAEGYTKSGYWYSYKGHGSDSCFGSIKRV